MGTENVEATPRRRWIESPWMMGVISLASCTLAFTAVQLCRFTLGPMTISHVIMALVFSGIIFGVIPLAVILVPVQCLLVLIGRWRKLKAKTISFLMQLPTAFVVCSAIASAVSWRFPTVANESKYFEGITGAPWPAGARMLLAEHGWGMQDKRHLWLFEGTPEQFDALVRARGWVLEPPPVSEHISSRVPVEKAIQRFSKDSAWSAHEVYFWMADKDAERGPFGPGFVITDKEHKRWCVWWDAI
ncbi:hypothetical protein [Prosthecobacter sp.]|uniref:hypothetical protein n=1 Tax=Prosthecobacter sp. TaxID=1965333 RepID=UPI001DAE1EED|nr:hypothetical protein [Prosthecobacter sp.]MCB1275985.1 hypothetical protein [Prosthecobacter sp.]